jgi:hypothetical protein
LSAQLEAVLGHYEETVEMLVDLQMAADSLSRLARDALIRLSGLAGQAERTERALLMDDEGSIP